MRQLAEGAVGVVYQAEHSTSGAPAAIKVIRPNLRARADIRARFLREGQVGLRLAHPNLMRVLAYGEDACREPPLPYIVAELLEGHNLAAYIDACKVLEASEAVTIALRVSSALEVVHAAGVIHRDIKSDNIFLHRDASGTLVPKLIDFGVLKTVAAGGDEFISATSPGESIGTPHAMAPEQVVETGVIDQRTDIYGLGIVLYHTLAGGVPFESRQYGELIVRIVHELPARIAERRGASVPLGLERVVMRCLEKDPVDRFQRMSDVTRALEEVGERCAGGELDAAQPRERGTESGRLPSCTHEVRATVVVSQDARGDDATLASARPAHPIEARIVASSGPGSGRSRRSAFWTVVVVALALGSVGLGFWLAGLGDDEASKSAAGERVGRPQSTRKP